MSPSNPSETQRRSTGALYFLSDGLVHPPRVGFHIHLLSLASHAAEHVETTVLAWSGEGMDTRSESADRGTADGPDAYRLHRFPLPPGSLGLSAKRTYVRDALAVIERENRPGSVVWVRGFSTALLLYPHMARLRRAVHRIRFVYDASSFVRLEAPPGLPGLAEQVKGNVEEWLWSQFDCVRTLGDPMRGYLVARGVPSEKIRIIPVGARRPARFWDRRVTEKRLLYVGSARPWQGLDVLLDAMEVIRAHDDDVRLTVIGVEASSLPGTASRPNVDFLGRIPHGAVEAAYLEHDLLIVPRRRSPLTEIVVPMKIPEAAAFGIPLLASDLAAIRWVAGERGALYVEPGALHALAAAVLDAVRAPERLREVGASLRESAQRFEWKVIGAQIAAEFFGDPEA